MKTFKPVVIILSSAMLSVTKGYGQGYEVQIRGLNGVLDELYSEMLPLCEKLISVGRGIAAFAAIFYIGHRIWRHLASAEPVDFYPLLRPFVLGFAILVVPSVINLINGVLSPAVRGTSGMVKDSDAAITLLLKKKEDAIKSSQFWEMYVGDDSKGNREKWLKYMYGDSYSEGFTDGIANDIKFYMAKQSYNFRNSIKAALSEILRVVFEAAALCINTIRTFHLIVLAIIGPLAFGISVFDGFQHTLTAWIARYINIYLWLPVANIFGAIIGKIQEKMIAMDIRQIEGSGDTFFNAHDMAYLIFLIIGIVGYFAVPSVAGYIIHAAGPNGLLHKTTSIFGSTVSSVSRMATPSYPVFGARASNSSKS